MSSFTYVDYTDLDRPTGLPGAGRMAWGSTCVASCAEPDGQSGKTRAHTSGTGRVGARCASGSDA